MVKSTLPKIYLNKRVLGEFTQARQNISNAYKKIVSNWQYKNNLESFLLSIDECFDLKKLYKENDIAKNINNHISKGVVIGIGGSNLFCQAVCGLMNLDNLVFLDSLDRINLQKIILLIEKWLLSNDDFRIFVISKSGTTLEVVINFSVILEKLKKDSLNWQNYLVIISDTGSDLSDFAINNNLAFFSIAKNVGGRFSLFTAASMIPLSYIGVDIESIKKSAKQVVNNFFQNQSSHDYENIIAQASCKYAAYCAGKNLNNLFIFDPSAYYLGQWYRQLFAESLVKSTEINFVPTVSLSVDLHSMTQLYLAGADIWWTMFLLKDFKQDCKLNINNLFNNNKRDYQDYQNILSASVCEAFEQRERSYTILICPSSELIGQICVSWILELFLLSIVFEVNPFDQPAVEYYKKNIYKKFNE